MIVKCREQRDFAIKVYFTLLYNKRVLHIVSRLKVAMCNMANLRNTSLDAYKRTKC